MTYDPFKEFLEVSGDPDRRDEVRQISGQFGGKGFVDPAVYLAVFSSPEGQLVLKDLHQRFVDVSRCVPGEPEGSGFYREGMAQVVYHIGAMIEGAAQGDEDGQD